MRYSFLSLGLLIVGLATACGAPRDSGEAINVDRQGRAAEGMDVVAYRSLEVGKTPIEGRTEFAYQWRGATWLFSSDENLQVFKTDPETYAPRFGGYCSAAMSQDILAASDAGVWVVRDDVLFLFARKKGRVSWSVDPPLHIERAEGNWPDHRERLTGAQR